MRQLVEALCSPECGGRAPGTPGGQLARRLVIDALRDVGLDPHEQPIPRCPGANVLATIPGVVDRWVLVAAHYDHLGLIGGQMYAGADDNAAAVGILVDVARELVAKRPDGRGVIVAAFDAEEPPYFLTEAMGSEHFARHPIVPLDRIDMMVCMDLVGHAVGPEGLPGPVRETVFALGAERSHGTDQLVDEIVEPGIVIRRADAEIVPPLSDYAAFWDRERPFLFLTSARSATYHTPEDTPDRLAWDKMGATSRWLARFVRASCERDERPGRFRPRRDDVSTLDSLLGLLEPLAEVSVQANVGLEGARRLRGKCQADGSLPPAGRMELAMLVGAIEAGLAGA
jgi:Zn-dependent M28 family amino/carboxypeptidase